MLLHFCLLFLFSLFYTFLHTGEGGQGARFLALMHTRSKEGHYTTFAYMFSPHPPFQILAASRPVPLRGAPRAFPSSLVAMQQHRKIIIGYGVHDEQARALVLSYSSLRDLFIWNTCVDSDQEWWDSWLGNRTKSRSTSTINATARELCLRHYAPISTGRLNTTNTSLDNITGGLAHQRFANGTNGTTTNATTTKAANNNTCLVCAATKSYCPSRTTEVLYTCPKGTTPARIGLTDVPLWLCSTVLVYVGAVAAVMLVSHQTKKRDAAAVAAAVVAISLGEHKEDEEQGNNQAWASENGGVATPATTETTPSATTTTLWYIYVVQEDEALSTMTGPHPTSDVVDQLLAGVLYSTAFVAPQPSTTTTMEPIETGDYEWMEVQYVEEFPRSQALEWYTLGEDGIMDGPYRRSGIKAWYGLGAVAHDLLVSNGGDWMELHEVFAGDTWDEDAEEEVAIQHAETKRSSTLLGGDQGSGSSSNGAGNGGDPNAMWYILYRREEENDQDDEEVCGPYPGFMVQEWLQWGDISGTTWISKGGASEWQAIHSVFDGTPAVAPGSTWSWCCCCNGGQKHYNTLGPTETTGVDIEMVPVAHPSIHDASAATKQTQKGHRSTRTVASFKQYIKQRRQSGFFAPPLPGMQEETQLGVNDETKERVSVLELDLTDVSMSHQRVVSAIGEDLGVATEQSWTQHLDETVDQYYYCRATGESKWEPPEEGFVQCDWTIERDATHENKVYYSNVVTGEVEWSKN